jgi:hypothetical protein
MIRNAIRRGFPTAAAMWFGGVLYLLADASVWPEPSAAVETTSEDEQRNYQHAVPLDPGTDFREYERLLAELNMLDPRHQAANDFNIIPPYPAESREPTGYTKRDETSRQRARIGLMERIVKTCPDRKDRSVWLRRCADELRLYAHNDIMSDGIARLRALYRSSVWAADDDRAYVRYTLISTEFGSMSRDPHVAYENLIRDHARALEDFVSNYRNSPTSAEAMLELAMAMEILGDRESAISWADRVVREFPSHERSRVAKGISWRLKSVGQSMELDEQQELKGAIGPAKCCGHVRVVVFWTSASFSKDDLLRIERMSKRSETGTIQVIGIHLELCADELNRWLQGNSWPGPLINQPNGFQGPMAVRYGILDSPTIFLLDARGNVVWNGESVAICADRLAKLSSGTNRPKEEPGAKPPTDKAGPPEPK